MAVDVKPFCNSFLRQEPSLSLEDPCTPESSFSSLRSEAELQVEEPLISSFNPLKTWLVTQKNVSCQIEVSFPTLSVSETTRRNILINSCYAAANRGRIT